MITTTVVWCPTLDSLVSDYRKNMLHSNNKNLELHFNGLSVLSSGEQMKARGIQAFEANDPHKVPFPKI